MNDPIPLLVFRPWYSVFFEIHFLVETVHWFFKKIYWIFHFQLHFSLSFHQLSCLFIQFNVHILSCSRYFNQSLLVFSRTSIRILFLTSVSSFRSLFMFSLNYSTSLNLFIIVLLNSVAHILCKFFLLGTVAVGSLGWRTVLVFHVAFFLWWDMEKVRLLIVSFHVSCFVHKDRVLTHSSRLSCLAESQGDIAKVNGSLSRTMESGSCPSGLVESQRCRIERSSSLARVSHVGWVPRKSPWLKQVYTHSENREGL